GCPLLVCNRYRRMEQAREPRELGRIGEDALGDRGAVVDEVASPTLLDRAAHLLVAGVQVVDDPVARHRGRTVAREQLERGALARADAAGECDCYDCYGRSGAGVGSCSSSRSAAASESGDGSSSDSGSSAGSSAGCSSVAAAGVSANTSAERSIAGGSGAPSGRGCTGMPSSTRLSESERRRRSASTSRISTLT